MNEQELRELIAAVKAGRVSRRAFARTMGGLGLTAPFVSQLVAHAGLAQSAAPIEYKPTRAGGGGALRARPQIIESTFDRVRYGVYNRSEYRMLWG